MLDDDRAKVRSLQAALTAAQSQAKAAQAGISAARTQVTSAEANVRALQATLARIDVELADSELKAPRDGRVQFRVVQPGEVVGAGARVLQLADLTDVIAPYLAEFNPAVMKRFTFEDKVHGIPQTIDMQLLYYRPSLLEAANVAVPTNFDELVAAAKAVKTSSYFSCCIKSLYNIPIFINNMCLSINLKTSHGVMGCWFMKRHIKCCYFNLNCTQRVRFFLSNFGSQYNS